MNNDKIKVLFVCIHNSARSQMAETYLNYFGQSYFTAESAGLEPGTLNPLVVEAMKQDGFDISNNKTKSVFQFFKEDRRYQYVITVCDESSAEKCPLFPGQVQRLHWSFPDPSQLQGTHEEKLIETGKIRDQIKNKVKEFISIFKSS